MDQEKRRDLEAGNASEREVQRALDPLHRRAERLSITILLFLLFFVWPAESEQRHTTLQHGDILAGGRFPSSIGFADGRFDWFLPTGELNLRVADTFDVFPLDVAVDRALRSYWVTGGGCWVYDRSGKGLPTFPGFPVYTLAITFDRTGNAYLGGGHHITKVSTAGTLISSFIVPYVPPYGQVGSLDLASDQCTMYYTAGGRRVFRYDVCVGSALADLSSDLPGNYDALALRILPDGGVLVAMAYEILRVSPTGEVTKVYDLAGVNGWGAIALDVDRTSFWATSGNTAYKLDIESGALLHSFQASDYLFWSIAVVGEPRAALAGPDIPTLSEWALLALALALTAVASVRFHAVRG